MENVAYHILRAKFNFNIHTLVLFNIIIQYVIMDFPACDANYTFLYWSTEARYVLYLW